MSNNEVCCISECCHNFVQPRHALDEVMARLMQQFSLTKTTTTMKGGLGRISKQEHLSSSFCWVEQWLRLQQLAKNINCIPVTGVDYMLTALHFLGLTFY